MQKIRIGVIGAGAISESHLCSYGKNDQVEVVAICDVNEGIAKARAEQYGISKFCNDYKDILQDESIDAISIVTPTFTHKNLVVEALKSGKHVLCEKPPAMNVSEAEETEKMALQSGKVLMYGFVVRFTPEVRFLKEYVAAGKMGEIYYAEASRLMRCYQLGGWFVDKEKSGGGALIDGAIHEIDTALYLMGYPKVKSVKGYTSSINADLPGRMKGVEVTWVSSDACQYTRNVENLASGYVHFDNGACLYIKASWVLNTVREGRCVGLHGTKAGAEVFADGLKLITADDTGYYLESCPVLRSGEDAFDAQINHFIDCCTGKAQCISTPRQGTQIMQIISAIYESAQTGKEIVF